MTRIKKWILSRIIRREIIQGFNHQRNIAKLYALIRESVEQEFTEDNGPTTDAFLRGLFESSQLAPINPIEFTAVAPSPALEEIHSEFLQNQYRCKASC